MGWFERNLEGREPEELETEIGRYLRAAEAPARDANVWSFWRPSLCDSVCGGGGRIALTDMETHPFLGGGPPILGGEEALQPLEAAIARLHRNMMTSLP